MKSNAYRPETIVHTIMTVVPTPAANTNFDIPDSVLPSGEYDISLYVNATATGTTTTLAAHALHADGTENDSAFDIVEPHDTASAALFTLTGGASQEKVIVNVVGQDSGVLTKQPVSLINGLRIKLVVGTAIAAEPMSVTVVATRKY